MGNTTIPNTTPASFGRALVIGLSEALLACEDAEIARIKGTQFRSAGEVKYIEQVPPGMRLFMVYVLETDPEAERVKRHFRQLASRTNAPCVIFFTEESLMESLNARMITQPMPEGVARPSSARESDSGADFDESVDFPAFMDKKIPDGYNFNRREVAIRIRRDASQVLRFRSMKFIRILAYVGRVCDERQRAWIATEKLAGRDPGTQKGVNSGKKMKPRKKAPAVKSPVGSVFAAERSAATALDGKIEDGLDPRVIIQRVAKMKLLTVADGPTCREVARVLHRRGFKGYTPDEVRGHLKEAIEEIQRSSEGDKSRAS